MNTFKYNRVNSSLLVIVLSLLLAGCPNENELDCKGDNCTNSSGTTPDKGISNRQTVTIDNLEIEEKTKDEDNDISLIEEAPEPPTQTIAAKNYLQINNTYASLTGVATDEPAVLEEYQAILMQLPTSNNPEALNGFNQIAQTRLGFAYCDQYVDNNLALYQDLEASSAIKLLLDNMIDVDIDNNPDHANLYQHLMHIRNDSDDLIGESDSVQSQIKLFKMSCAALLASSYVTLM